MHFFVSPGAFGVFSRRAAACGENWGGWGRGEKQAQQQQAEEQSTYRRGARGTLRFMAQRLDLDDGQVAGLAQIIDDLDTERAQVAVDERRTAGIFADALLGEKFDEERVSQATAQRVQAQERLRDAVLRTIRRSHSLLRPEQRQQLSYLLRTGALTI